MKLKTYLVSTIVLHYIIFVSFVMTAIFGFLFLPWFIALSLTALIGRVIYSRDECPLTTYENFLRKRLKLIESKGFLKDYILRPKKTILYLYNTLK